LLQDKTGKPLDLSNATTKTTSTTATSPPPSSSDAGQKMLELARSLKEGSATAKTTPQVATEPSNVFPDGAKVSVDTAPPLVATEPAKEVTPLPSSLQQVLAAEEPVPAPAASATALYRVYTKETLLRYGLLVTNILYDKRLLANGSFMPLFLLL
jgi:hypothetical protein